jgi:hypothetical protein
MPRAADALPDFFVLGVAKGGTTSLHDYLRQHPSLFLPYVKELNFFDAPEDAFRTDLDRYLRYFAGVDARLTGEATPSYFRHVGLVADRMRSLYGDLPPRFLLLLRDPVERAYSHYLHNVSEGAESLSFREALEAERARPEDRRRAWKGYFGDGAYADTLTEWFAAFSRDRFLVVLSADLAQRPDATLRRIFRFLEVTPSAAIDTDRWLNRTGERQSRVLGTVLSALPSGAPSLLRRWAPGPLRLIVEQFVRRRSTGSASDRPTLDPALEQGLRARYAPHIRRLEDLIDRDLSAWMPASQRGESSHAA